MAAPRARRTLSRPCGRRTPNRPCGRRLTLRAVLKQAPHDRATRRAAGAVHDSARGRVRKQLAHGCGINGQASDRIGVVDCRPRKGICGALTRTTARAIARGHASSGDRRTQNATFKCTWQSRGAAPISPAAARATST